MDWTPGAAILDSKITMHGSDQYDFGCVQRDRSAWSVALLVIVSDVVGCCVVCWRGVASNWWLRRLLGKSAVVQMKQQQDGAVDRGFEWEAEQWMDEWMDGWIPFSGVMR